MYFSLYPGSWCTLWFSLEVWSRSCIGICLSLLGCTFVYSDIHLCIEMHNVQIVYFCVSDEYASYLGVQSFILDFLHDSSFIYNSFAYLCIVYIFQFNAFLTSSFSSR